MEDREAKALRDRRVWVEPETDGMARLCVLTAAPVAEAMRARIQGLAYAVQPQAREKADGAGAAGRRSRGNIAADVAAELLLTGEPSTTSTGHMPAGWSARVTAEVQVIVPALTLLPKDLRDRLRQVPELQELAGVGMPAEMPGYGPISDEVARMFALEATGWDAVVIHPQRASVLTVAYRWEVTQDDDGILTWRSPLGAEFREDPETGVIFQPVSGSFGLGSGHRGAHNDDDESESSPPF